IEAATPLPFLHIADANAEAIRQQGLQRVALLATRFTMEEDFYTGRLRDKYGLQVLLPNEQERGIVHEIIYREMCVGVIREESRQAYTAIINRLIGQG
ncbi:aspartate/glutamate racemase family protein, partial [Rhizobium ruizarguesonis]